MEITYPHTIVNGSGEKLIFHKVETQPGGDRVIGESFVEPGSGPPMHVHWQQDECFTVVQGKIAYQIQGQPVQYAGPGEIILFERGVGHRFWNAGEDTLHCQAWVEPAFNLVYFLSAIFAAQKKSGTTQPELFDAAFLMTRYASEFGMLDMPPLVRKVVLPAVYRLGRVLGKYRHFEDAPEPMPVVGR